MANNYVKEKYIENVNLLNNVKSQLPSFCNEFFLGIESMTTILTRLNYARDILTFFNFLVTEVAEFVDKEVKNLELTDLDKLTLFHIELYLNYLSLYTKNDIQLTNTEVTKSRKISSVRSMLKYFYRKGEIKENIGDKIVMPKIREKEIIRLDNQEINDLLDLVESGSELSKTQKIFHEKSYKRDVTIITLMLGTGIRVSECVGLNINDINLSQKAFTVTRKGGKRSILYFSDEIKDLLEDYLNYRLQLNVNDDALFLSRQNKRIGVRGVEKLVQKYASITTPLKHITPHKLRSTYGTNLYRETNDIYVVAQVLGHSDVNTTKKHYAAIDEDIKKEASNKVLVRKKDNE